LEFQCFTAILPTRFVHPVSCFKKDKTAETIYFSTVPAVFTNAFCPISLIYAYRNPQKEAVTYKGHCF